MSDPAREIEASARRIHALALIRGTFRPLEALDALRAYEQDVVAAALQEQLPPDPRR